MGFILGVVVVFDEPANAGNISAYASGERLLAQFFKVGDTLLDGPVIDSQAKSDNASCTVGDSRVSAGRARELKRSHT